jgi:hypothetical protein
MAEWTKDRLDADLMILRSMVGHYAGNEEFHAFGRVYRVASAAPTMAEALELAQDVLIGTARRLAEHGKSHHEIDATLARIDAALALAKGEDRNG